MEGGPCEDRGEGGHPQAKESGLRRNHPCPHLIPDCSLQDQEHSISGLSPRLWCFVLWLRGRRSEPQPGERDRVVVELPPGWVVSRFTRRAGKGSGASGPQA